MESSIYSSDPFIEKKWKSISKYIYRLPIFIFYLKLTETLRFILLILRV